MVRVPTFFCHSAIAVLLFACGWQAFSGGGTSSRLTRLGDTSGARSQPRHMNPETRLLLQRMEDRRRVAEEASAGRMSLRDAAELFHTLNAGVLPDHFHILPGATKLEKLCRQVINYSGDRDGAGIPQNPESVRRLEEELACLLASGELRGE